VAAAAGVSAAYEDPSDPALEPNVTPTATAALGISWAPGGNRPGSSLMLRLEPFVDRLTGATLLRTEASASVSHSPGRGWALEGRGIGAQVRPMDNSELPERSSSLASTIGSLELRASRRAGASVEVSGGVYGAWQRSGGVQLPSFFEWGTFFAISTRTERRATR
jgi:hypothetical protein